MENGPSGRFPTTVIPDVGHSANGNEDNEGTLGVFSVWNVRLGRYTHGVSGSNTRAALGAPEQQNVGHARMGDDVRGRSDGNL